MTHVASSENLFNKEQFQCNSTIWVLTAGSSTRGTVRRRWEKLARIYLVERVDYFDASRFFELIELKITRIKKGVRVQKYMMQCTIPQIIFPQNVDVKDTIIYNWQEKYSFASPSLEQYFPNTKRADISSNNDLNVQYLISGISAHHNSKLRDSSKTKTSN